MLVDVLINLCFLTNQHQPRLLAQLLGHIPDDAVHLLEGTLQRHHAQCHHAVLQLPINLVQLPGSLLEIVQLKAGQVRILGNHGLGNNQFPYQVHQLVQLVHPDADHLGSFPVMHRRPAACHWRWRRCHRLRPFRYRRQLRLDRLRIFHGVDCHCLRCRPVFALCRAA